MPKAIVFIDGNNFYFKLKDLSADLKGDFSLLNFGYQDFCKFLTKSFEFIEARYYIGALKRQQGSEKSELMYANQQKLFGKLQQEKVIVVTGHLIRHPDKTFHEKGVDVRLAVEMIRLARHDKFDFAYLLSSDTDLIPAVEEVQSFGKKVIYVGISKGQSFGLTKQADDVILLREEDIKPFILK